MVNFAFNRKIPITSLYQGVKKWRQEYGMVGVGFTVLTTELCDLFSQYDPEWIGEGGWTDALDQYVYVEYITLDAEGQTIGVKPLSMEDEQTDMKENVKVSLRSCEDDFCLEMLASDIMVRYCLAEHHSDALWKLVIKETSVMSFLYELNGKVNSFWKELFKLNKTLGVINEQPMVKVFVGENQVLSFEYSSNIPLPLAQTNDFMLLDWKGYMRKFFVEEKTFIYEHPFNKLGEIHIKLYEPL